MTTAQDQQSRAEFEKVIRQALDGTHIEDGTTYWLDRVVESILDAATQAARALPQGMEPVAHIRKNGFRFNGEIEPQDDSELPLFTAAQVQAMLDKEQASRKEAQQQLEDCKTELAKLERYRFMLAHPPPPRIRGICPQAGKWWSGNCWRMPRRPWGIS